MPDSKPGETVDGACFCGAVAFEITLPTRFCGHCHCTMCRRAHGAGFVTWIGAEKAGFRYLAGEDRVEWFESSNHGRRAFCKACGSSLFCENDGHPDVIDVVLANMNGPIDREPQAHFYFDTKAEWIEINDDLPRITDPDGHD